MDTKALRQKILDLAIRGKLVPQDPSDEPASVLLERIRAEKQQMVKDGKLKAKDIKNDTVIFVGEDNLHYEKFADGSVKCIEDEIPFELPEGWAWIRLGCITDVIQYGLSNSAETSGDYRLLRITDIQDGRVDWDLVPFTTTEDPEKYLLHKDDIVFARTGATVGKSFLITDLPYASVYASYLIRIRLISDISANYIYQFFNSYCYWEQITGKAVGVGQPNCNGTSLKELFIPLPPKEEQKRIVPAANKLLKIADVISSERDQLDELIQATKSKILDLAIRGKLVPQNPNDEPASVLLERIRTEKEALIKAGKLKRDKKESIIFRGDDNSYYLRTELGTEEITDDLPFEIPGSWEWAKIGDVMQINPRNKLDDSMEVSFIPMPLIDDGFSGRHTSDVRMWKSVKSGFTHFMEGDIGVAKITPCFENRKSVVFKNLANGYGAGTTELHILRPYASTILAEYVLAYVKSSMFIDNGIQEFTGAVGQQRIGKDYVEGSFFPIPPLAEQARIVVQIAVAFKQLDIISNALL